MLKKILFASALAFVLILSSCSHKQSERDALTNGLPSSGGKTLEMIIVTPDSLYRGALLDSIHQLFEKACDGLPQPEPWFDVAHLTPSAFTNSDMFPKHRNILIIDKRAGNPNTIRQSIDAKVYPQAIFEIKADNMDSIYSLLSKYAKTIRYHYRDNEHRRMYNAYKRDENIKITEAIKKTFSFSMVMSADFYIAKQEKNFFWIRKETQKESFDIMIYKKPFTSNDLILEKKIIDLRDSLGKAFIPGPMEGSYMGTETRMDIIRDSVQMGDFAMLESRGQWRLFGDFMAGPFVNYVFRNPASNELIMIDCFLYNPNKPKRDLLMQLESVVYSAKLLK